MSTRRRFSRTSERVALFFATDGRCADCGTELEPSWHADHVLAFAQGGLTDVVNGFAEFVVRPPLAGLGTTVEFVRQLVAKDPAALDLLDQAMQNPEGAAGHGSTVDNIHGRPAGTSKDVALRRLRKDRPDLHAQVLEGALSAHRAMVEAGFRRRTITVPADDPDRLAATLRRQLDPAALQRLRELLG